MNWRPVTLQEPSSLQGQVWASEIHLASWTDSQPLRYETAIGLPGLYRVSQSNKSHVCPFYWFSSLRELWYTYHWVADWHLDLPGISLQKESILCSILHVKSNKKWLHSLCKSSLKQGPMSLGSYSTGQVTRPAHSQTSIGWKDVRGAWMQTGLIH